MSKTVNCILAPYTEGKSCIVLQGRSLNDLELNMEGQIQPVIEILRNIALTQHQLITVQYSRSTGLTYDLSDLNQNEQKAVKQHLSSLGIDSLTAHPTPGDDTEFVRILRGLLKLGQQRSPLTLRDNAPLRFLIIIEFPEHLLPRLNPGTQTPDQMICIELVQRLSTSLGFRKSNSYTILAESRPGLLDSLIYQNINTVVLPQPSIEEKTSFLGALQNRYPKSHPVEDLNNETIANIAHGTPNRSLESILLSSERTGRPYSATDIFVRKQSDIIALSEGTLQAIDHERVSKTKLYGVTVERPMQILSKVTQGLKRGDKNIPRNIILCGAPSTGKTLMALLAAAQAGVPTFELNSPKNQYVGESERRMNLMLNILKEQGGLGIIDELELVINLNRNQSTADSGVTQNLIGQLQSFLADTSLAGRVCLVGTSNRPDAIGEAMRQRWVIVPVLLPTEQDFSGILLSIASELNPHLSLGLDDPQLVQAASKFYEAGAAPREIREALIASQISIPGELGIKHIEFASYDIIPNGNQIASYHADYVALSYCRNNSYLPWWDHQTNRPGIDYPYPLYIREILTSDLMIDSKKLNQRIHELQPYANV